jgi:hypothetical protein
MPAIVGVCGLSDVRDGQRFGRGHPVSQGEEGYSNRADAKKSDHAPILWVAAEWFLSLNPLSARHSDDHDHPDDHEQYDGDRDGCVRCI